MNAITINDTEFLLTVTAGEAIHLSREARPGEARFPTLMSPEHRKSWVLRSYDHAARGIPVGRDHL